MAVSAGGQIMLSSTVQLREATGLGGRKWGLVKFSNGEIMGRKLELQGCGGSGGRTKNVGQQHICMSLTADVASESKVPLLSPHLNLAPELIN